MFRYSISLLFLLLFKNLPLKSNLSPTAPSLNRSCLNHSFIRREMTVTPPGLTVKRFLSVF